MTMQYFGESVVRLLATIFFLCFTLFFWGFGYDLPNIAFGSASFFDGGPLRARRGLYLQTFAQYYSSDKFLDARGHLLEGLPSPRLNVFATATQLIFITKRKFLNAKIGFDAAIPLYLHNHVSANKLGITTEGGGWGDLVLGAFLQWDAIFKKDGLPLFVHRLEFDVYCPTGFNEAVPGTIYPGNGFFFIDPYWAATWFITRDWSLSGRISYAWSAKGQKNRKTGGLGSAFELHIGIYA